GIPKSFRHMHGYGSHAYSMINAEGVRHWVKFHFRTQQGIECLTDAEAGELIGRDRESHGRDLFEAIERGDYPKWGVYIQVMPEADAATYRFHPFDLTKVWSQRDYPLIEVGEFELNRNPDNYFADVEQAAFTPANLVPGISFSPDKMLQGRLFAYGDAARYRVGVNHHQIPVNYPRAAKLVNTYHRDGAMRVDGNQGGVAGVEPNNFGRWAEQPAYADPAQSIGTTADHFDFREDDDNYFEQPGDLFRLMTGDEQQRLFDNTARAIKGARHQTVEKHIANCTLAAPHLWGGRVQRSPDLDQFGVDVTYNVIDDPKAPLDTEVLDLASRIFDMARSGDAAMLAAYLDAGAPVKLTNTNGDTLVMLAAYYGHESTVAALIARGADVNRHNNRGQTPLAGAIFKNDTTIIELLLRADADPLAGSPSALETARFFGKEQLARQLLQHMQRRRSVNV